MTIKIPPEHNYKIIVVPNEKMIEKPAIGLEIDDEKGNIYMIQDYFFYPKKGIFPASLIMLAVGKHLDSKVLYSAYPRSSGVYLLIVEKQK